MYTTAQFNYILIIIVVVFWATVAVVPLDSFRSSKIMQPMF